MDLGLFLVSSYPLNIFNISYTALGASYFCIPVSLLEVYSMIKLGCTEKFGTLESCFGDLLESLGLVVSPPYFHQTGFCWIFEGNRLQTSGVLFLCSPHLFRTLLCELNARQPQTLSYIPSTQTVYWASSLFCGLETLHKQ